jgi:hypothetical protein
MTVLVILSFLLWLLYLASITRIFISGNGELVYSGKINFEHVAEVQQLYENASIKPTTLHIKSSGGGLAAGGKFGDWIHKNGLDVKVTKKCYSTCANYIFPAGKRSLLGKKAKLLWHASFHSTSFLRESGRVNEQTTRKTTDVDLGRLLEQNFYEKIGVDPQLPTYGEAYYYANLHGNLMYDAGYDGFYYSVEDMRKMGINVVLLDNVWLQGLNNSKNDKMYKAVVPENNAYKNDNSSPF